MPLPNGTVILLEEGPFITNGEVNSTVVALKRLRDREDFFIGSFNLKIAIPPELT